MDLNLAILSYLFYCNSTSPGNLPSTFNDAFTYLFQATDQKASICEDFYGYTCGNFKSNSGKPESTKLQQQHLIDSTLIKAIQSINLNQPGVKPYFKAVKIFFDQCMSIEDHPERTQKELYEALVARLGPLTIFDEDYSIPDPKKAWALAGKLIGFFNDGFYGVGVVASFTCCQFQSKYFAHVNICQSLDNFTSNMWKIATILSIEPEKTEAIIRDMIPKLSEFCHDFRSISLEKEESDTNPIIFTFDNISEIVPNFEMKTYIENVVSKEFYQKISRDQPKDMTIKGIQRFNKFGQLFAKYSYQIVHTFAFIAKFNHETDWPNPSKELIESSEQKGHPIDSLELKCFFAMAGRHIPALTGLYFDYLNLPIAKWRLDTLEIAQNVKNAFSDLINENSWIIEKEKENLQKQSVFENYFQMRRALLKYGFYGKIEKEDVPDEEFPKRFPYISLTVDPIASKMSTLPGYFILGAGLALPPIYHIDYPIALKYGGLGYAMAQFFMGLFDSDFLKNQLFSKETYHEFEMQTKCLRKQFAFYCDNSIGKCISSDGFNENVAEVAAIKVAYLAFKKAEKKANCLMKIEEEPIADYAFFLAAARLHCATKEFQLAKLQRGETPNEARIQVGFSHSLVFGKVHECPVGAKYSPVKTCHLWGDMPGKYF